MVQTHSTGSCAKNVVGSGGRGSCRAVNPDESCRSQLGRSLALPDIAGAALSNSFENLVNYFTINIRQPKIAAGVAIRQALVIESQNVQ